MGTDITIKHPPVVETVLGVQFERLRGLTNGHLGAFWRERKKDWLHVADAPPLDEQFETFGKRSGWERTIQLRLTRVPSSRLQIRNPNGDRMIQLQNCRIDYNWIGQAGAEYPRYRQVRPEFDEILAHFRSFVEEYRLGRLVANQWEVTYVNHMPQGTVWNSPDEWPSLFRLLPGLAVVPDGTRLEGFGGHWHYEIKPQRGRLHVEVQHALVGEGEKKEALVMKLTARGPIDQTKDLEDAVDAGLNLGHDVIVQGFVALVSQRALDYWNANSREDANASR